MEKQSIENCRGALMETLLEESYCSTPMEAQAIVESMEGPDCTVALLQDNLNVSESQAKELFRIICEKTTTPTNQNVEDSEEELETSEISEDDGEAEEMLSPGECELCERFILLTKHHLIPKSTWNRLIARPEQFFATSASIPITKLSKPDLRAHVAWICRPCHDAIHKYHDNWTLAVELNTVEKLLMDEQIYKFCKWAHKQKAGKYKVKGS